MTARVARVAGIAVAAFGFASGLLAQGFFSHPPSFSLTLPNYNMTPIGQPGGMQGGAFVARANDASSNWYNPAGLALAEKPSISASAGTYQLLSLVPKDLEAQDTGGSSQQVPALVGVVVKRLFGDDQWTGGFAAVRTNSWEQQTDAQTGDVSTIPGRLLSYSADSSYKRTEVSFGVGYNQSDQLRFGAVLAAALTSLRAVGSVSDQNTTPTGLDAGLAARRASGSTTQLRLEAGAQYQLNPEILFGATLRTPGVTITRSGEYSYDTMATLGPATASLSFFDPDPHFSYHLPFQAALGAALVKDRFQVEVDATFSSGSSPYDLFSSSRTATLIVDQGTGGPPEVTQIPFGQIVSENRAVVNVALGGSYALTENGVWMLYFGFNTDFSPVGDADDYFSRVDLYGVTTGISGTWQGLTAAVGINYQWGDASNVPLADLLDSNISLSSWAVIYSLAYKF